MSKYVALLILFSFAVVGHTKKQDKKFEAFLLDREAFLYRRPLLASAPAEGLANALPKGTELLIVYTTKSGDWSFVKGRTQIEGWIPSKWIQSKYKKITTDWERYF